MKITRKKLNKIVESQMPFTEFPKISKVVKEAILDFPKPDRKQFIKDVLESGIAANAVHPFIFTDYCDDFVSVFFEEIQGFMVYFEGSIEFDIKDRLLLTHFVVENFIKLFANCFNII